MIFSSSTAASPPLRAILFDFGGTLDGGLHWLEHFAELYRRARISLPWDDLRAAFDFAEQQAANDPSMRQAELRQMLTRHVGWQFEFLKFPASERQQIINAFSDAVAAAAKRNAVLLRDLADDFTLGVISNGCGNTAVLCRELGYAPYLKIILDSALVRLSKPDPAFFRHAAACLELNPAEILMVGDSYERDMQPAKIIGMQAAWLTSKRAPQREVDFQLASLEELRGIVTAAHPLQ